jgi:excisionase family DNA binding protein
MAPLLLRPSEAATLLGLGRSKVYELAAAGVIPSIRIDRSIRIPMDALQKWIEANTTSIEQHRTENSVNDKALR